ncbi:ribosome 60S biogenesis N-terminal-domain-containing protein [Lipomyces kononenkoae]
MTGKRSRGGGGNVVNDGDKIIDPAFTALEALLVPSSKSQQSSQYEIPDNILLVQNLENGLSDQLVEAWAKLGQTSATSNSFIDATTQLEKLLHSLSREEAFRIQGLNIIRSILDGHLKLIYRALYTQRPSSVIPPLQLLHRFATFQQGAVADDTYFAFDFSLAVLPKLLIPPKHSSQEGTGDGVKKGKSAQRSIRYYMAELLLAFLKYCSSKARADCITQRQLIEPLLKNVSHDDPEQLVALLHTLYNQAMDISLPKPAKTSFFSEWVLGRILHIIKIIESLPTGHELSPNVTFNLITDICTRTSCGVRFEDRGWYSPGMLDDTEKRKSYKVYNRVLLAFSRMLDLNNKKQEELLIAIFGACPEIVAAYTSSTNLRIVPKPTAGFLRWFNQYSKIIALPIPQTLIDSNQVLEFPPAVNIVVENILPSPITRQMLETGLQSSSQIVRHFLLSLQVQAMMKLQKVVTLYDNKGWISGKSALLEEIYRRLPELTNVASMKPFGSYNSTLLISKWLRLYVTVFADISATAKIDISARMMDIVLHLVPSNQSGENSFDLNNVPALVLEMRNLLFVQGIVPVPAKFWNKPDHREYSLLTYLILFATVVRDRSIFSEIAKVLVKITSPTYLFQHDFPISPIHILIESLKVIMLNSSQRDSRTIWYLINEAIARCLRSPFKYIDQAKQFSGEDYHGRSFSPFLTALIEQWAYLAQSNNDEQKATATVLHAIKKIVVDFCLSGEDFHTSQAHLLHLVTNDGDLKYKDDIAMYCSLPDVVTAATSLVYGLLPPDRNTLVFDAQRFVFPNAGSDVVTPDQPLDAQLTDIGFLELYRLYRAAEYGVIHAKNLLPVSTVAGLLAGRLSCDVQEAAMKYIRRKDYWQHLLWMPEDESFVKLEFTKSFFIFVNTVMNKNTTSKEELGFVYDYITTMLPMARKSSKIVGSFIPGLALLDRQTLLGILSENMKYSNRKIAARICGEAISALLTVSPSTVGDFQDVDDLLQLAVVSEDEKLVFETRTLLRSKRQITFKSDIQYLGQVFDSSNKDLYDLVCDVMVASKEAFTYVINNHCDSIIAMKTDSLLLFAKAIADCLFDNNDKSPFYKRRDGIENIPVPAAKTLIECIKRVGASRVEQDSDFFIKVVLVLSTEEDCALFYEHITCHSNKPNSAHRIAYTHAMYHCNAVTSNIKEDAARYMKSVVARITRYLSESESLSPQQLAIIVSATNFFSEFPHAFAFGKYVNPPIQAAIARWANKEEVMNFAFSLMFTASKPGDLEYVKFLQMIAESGQKYLSDSPTTEPSSLSITRACMVHYLYFLNPQSHVDAFVATRLMMLYSGTCGPADRLLLSVFHTMDTLMNLSASVKIASYRFTYDVNMQMTFCDQVAQGLEFVLSGKTFGNSIKHMSNENFQYSSAHAKSVSAYMDHCNTAKCATNPYAVYDPLFMLPVIMDIASRGLVDAKLLTENHCIGYVINCLGKGGSVCEMARRTLIQLIKLFENSRYKERDMICLLLYNLHYLVEEFEKSQAASSADKATPMHIPPIIATVYANLIPVLANPGHFLYESAIRYLTEAPVPKLLESTKQLDIPLYRVLLPSGDVDGYSRATNWMLNVLVMALKSKEDAIIYERKYVFEIAQTIETNAFVADSTKKLVKELLDRARNILAMSN